MRRFTDTYNAARLAGAKPILLAYVETNTVMRCFGKETPQEAHLDTTLNPMEWAARVMDFGDFTRRAASDGEQVFLSLIEEEMASYTLTCDNVDHYFSIISGKETFLGGRFILKQGFEYPGFVFSDFQQLFFGTISKPRFGFSQCLITAKQTANTVTAESPTISTSKLYGLSNAGSGFTAASAAFPYATLEPVFYADEDWEFSIEFIRDSDTQAETLFEIENNAFDSIRLEIGIDVSDFPYITVSSDVDTGSPSYETYTADFALSSGTHRLQVDANSITGDLTISDNAGNSYVISLGLRWAYTSQFGSTGTGDNQYDTPASIAIAANGNMYVTDEILDRVQILNSSGVYQDEFGGTGATNGLFDNPKGVAIDSYGNVWVVDANNDRVQKFDASGNYLDQFGTAGTGNGQFDVPTGIAISSDNYIYVSDLVLDRVQKFDTSGNYLDQFGSTGSGENQYNQPQGLTVDTLGNVWVADQLNHRIQQVDQSGNFLQEFGESGSANGEFNQPTDIFIDVNQRVLVSDTTNNRIQEFNTNGSYQRKFGSVGSGNGEFSNPQGIAIDTTGGCFVVDVGNDRIQKITIELENNFDMTDTAPTSTDDVILGDDFEGDIITAKFNDTFQLVNTDNGETDFLDVIGGNDLTLDDGTWVEYADLNTNTDAIETAYPADILGEIPLSFSSRYTSPGDNQQNIALPLPYGNCIENSDADVHVCPLIDSAAFVYCVAGWPIQSVANGNVISVYVDGVLTAAGWTFDESNDYESQGNIAILDFAADPGGVVSVRCNGKWVDGALLTNPVDIIEDLVNYTATLTGNSAWKLNTTSFAQGAAYCDENSFVAAGVILSENTLGYWIKNILASFLGSFSLNTEGEIELFFLPMSYAENVTESLSEYEAIDAYAQEDVGNVVKQIVTNYAVSFAKVDRRFKNNAQTSYFQTLDETGTSTVAGAKVLSLNFDWNRKTQSVVLLHEVLFALYGTVQKTVVYQGQDFKFLIVDVFDQLDATLSFLRDADGAVISDQVLELRELVCNLDDFTSTLKLTTLDAQLDVLPGSRLYLNNSRLYLGTASLRLGG